MGGSSGFYPTAEWLPSSHLPAPATPKPRMRQSQPSLILDAQPLNKVPDRVVERFISQPQLNQTTIIRPEGCALQLRVGPGRKGLSQPHDLVHVHVRVHDPDSVSSSSS